VLSGPAAPVAAAGVPILRTPTPEWLAAWGRAEGRAPADVAAHARLVLAQLDGRTAYALDGGAVGLVVCEDDLAGLFCIAVEPDRRRHGLGTQIVAALAAHALAHGARELYVEVEERNAPALALYARLGFTRRYGYVHRVAPGAGRRGPGRRGPGRRGARGARRAAPRASSTPPYVNCGIEGSAPDWPVAGPGRVGLA
jgi:GNAT superfamily N-acetyltransferase